MNSIEFSQQETFQTLVDQLDGTAIWIISGTGEFEYISEGLEDTWGLSTSEIRANPEQLLESIHPEDREYIRSRMEGDPAEATAYTSEVRVVRPSGDIRWMKVQQVPIRDEDGAVEHIIGISTDITEEKHREQELSVLNRLLRHDIRNDINIVLGWAEMVADHVDAEGQDYLAKVVASGEHILELTDISREYAEAVADDTEVLVKPTPLKPTLERELSLRRESYPDAEFEVVTDIPDVDVQANQLLGSVFRNLLNNAVQHNDKPTPRVEISCPESENGVVVCISDNGPGIPDRQKERVFGADTRTVDSAAGGMGLHLVTRLVDGYGGEIHVEDNEPSGVEICVHLRT